MCSLYQHLLPIYNVDPSLQYSRLYPSSIEVVDCILPHAQQVISQLFDTIYIGIQIG